MKFSRPVEEIIRERHSCRTYLEKPIEQAALAALERHMNADIQAPFGGRVRFTIVAAKGEGTGSPRKIGTYGVIKGAPAFIAGAIREEGERLEDYGYRMERIILAATDAGLGTCWLGGTFARSDFAAGLSLGLGETIPAVAALGYDANRTRVLDALLRFGAGSNSRKPWSEIFFNGAPGAPLAREAAGAYETVLELARLAPSASNHQPWRVVRDGKGRRFHFYLQRTKGYRERGAVIGNADLQHVDMGIAMCHFEAAATGTGLRGTWVIADPGLPVPDSLTEYVVTWQEE
jgi:nitroreductase